MDAVPCLEILITDEVRERARQLADAQPQTDNTIAGTIGDMLAKLSEGIPVDGMGGAAAGAAARRADPADRAPARRNPCWCDPRRCAPPCRRSDPHRPGVPGGLLVGVARSGVAAPVDIESPGGSGFRELEDVPRGGRPLVDAEPADR